MPKKKPPRTQSGRQIVGSSLYNRAKTVILNPNQIKGMQINSHCRLSCRMRRSVTQTLLIMKLATVILLSTCLQVSASGFSQKITLSEKNAPLEKVFMAIEKQTSYVFFFDYALLNKSNKLSIETKNSSLEEVLEKCFKDQPLTYSIVGKTIVIKRRDEESTIASANKLIAPPLVAEVKGKVTNENGDPLAGASVVIKNSNSGTQTGADGSFTIDAAPNAILLVSFVGYESKEILVKNNQQTLNITLTAQENKTSEIVVIGYGTARKKDVTGSVSQVKAADIRSFPTTNIIQALSGRAAGVQVMQNNGSPGGSISVRIRGTNSIYGGNEPLYVVDGFPVSGNPTFLQNADIESIDILKDASSIAIYGARGANGVVMITTKSGKKTGRAFVDFESGYSIQMPAKKMKLMNAQQYALFYNEQAVNDNATPFFTQQQIEEFGKSPGTDWQGLVMHNAPLFSNNLNINGGNEKTQYSFSIGTFLQDGIVRNSDFDRYSVRTVLSHEISKVFSVSSNLSLVKIMSNRQNSGRGNRGSDLISGMMSAPPTLSPFTQTGAYRRLNTAYPFISNAINNPLTTINNVTDKIDADRILANVAFTIKPIKNFTLKVSGGVERSTDRTDIYARIDTTTNYTGYAEVSSAQRTSFLNENIATYSNKFGIHGLTVTAGFTYQDNTFTTLSGNGTGFISDVTESYNLGLAESPGIPGSYYEKWVMLSGLGRVNYSLLDKYLLTLSYRADGSSRFTDKWGYFPSAALAWRLSDEAFLKPISFISDLKLRASYGSVGNPSINPYATLNQLSASKTIFGDALYNALAPGGTLPRPLKWESTDQFDIGLDAAILDNQIRITFDYYRKVTRDLLNKVQLPSSTGYYDMLQNIGKVENKGFEIGVDANVLRRGPVKWNVSVNFSRSKNKVLKLYGSQDIYGEGLYTGNLNDFINLLREGQPMSVFYGYKETGYNNNGIPVFEDINKDGVITAADKTYIGNPNPDFIFGFNSSLAYKGFDLTIFIQGSQGNDIFNLNKATALDLGMGLNQLAEVYTNHWTPANPHAKYPKLTRSLPGNMSDRFVEDGSFLRFRNIQLAYNLNGTKIGVRWLRNAQIYISGQNLITFTKYSWYDPEMNVFGGSNSIRQGIDYFSYPTSKPVTFGIRCGF